MIKTISFDLWMTLIASNGGPNKPRRAQALYAFLSPCVSLEEFTAVVLKYEDEANKRCMTEPVHYGPRERLRLITSHFGLPEVTNEAFAALYREQSARFLDFPPEILRADTLEVLDRLSQHYTLAITSNTGFVNGAEMRPALNALGLLKFFSVQIFSNEVGINKPQPLIFKKMLRAADSKPDEALHVGDNLVADYEGARAAGIQAIHTPDPSAPLGTILAEYL